VSEPAADAQLEGFLEIRKPGAHLDEDVVADDFVLMLGVDLTNFPKFPRVHDSVTYPKGDLDIRQQLDVDSGAELPDYGAPTGRTCGSPTSPKRPWPQSFSPGASGTYSSALTGGPQRWPSGMAPR
jgi:hypothetical protein